MSFEQYSPKIEKPSFLKEQNVKSRNGKKIEMNRKIEKDKENGKCNRRNFLKYAGTSIMAASGFKTLKEIVSFFYEKDSIIPKVENKQKIEDAFNKIVEDVEINKKEELRSKEFKTISEIFKLGYDQPIEINAQNFLATKEFWKRQHSENPSYVNSFKMAWERMEKYEKELKAIFKKEGVPEKFIYLSIPESYWNCEKNPGKKAKGVFQITRDTGRIYGMAINSRVDDRDDPIKSGLVAAKHLADSHKITNDWDIDLAAYNGSMANSYLEKTSINQSAYKNFLEYTGKETIGDEGENFFNYTILKEDNLWDIAYRFGTSANKIKKQNGINSDKIIFGQTLKIEIPDQEKIKNSKRSYEGFLAYMQDKARQKKNDILALKFLKYSVEKGDTVYRIARRFNISEAELKSKNNIGSGNKIRLRQILKIPISQETKKRFYKIAMSKYVENLNYPPKFNAIMELIEEGFVKRTQDFQVDKNNK